MIQDTLLDAYFEDHDDRAKGTATAAYETGFYTAALWADSQNQRTELGRCRTPTWPAAA